MAILTVENIQKEYGMEKDNSILAIKELNLSVEEKQFVSIVGPSGCGKTTLLKIIAGLLKPTKGKVFFNSKEIDAPLENMILVFQEYNKSLLPWRTVRGNVKLGLEVMDLSEGEKGSRVKKYLQMVGLSEFAQHYPWELSGGMQQRVAIARALACEPKLLLMDEPFGSLDGKTRTELEDEFLDLWGGLGLTVLFVTHDLDEAIYLSNRVLVLTERPAMLKEDITIDLSYPRNQLETRSNEKYINYRYKIYKLLGKA